MKNIRTVLWPPCLLYIQPRPTGNHSVNLFLHLFYNHQQTFSFAVWCQNHSNYIVNHLQHHRSTEIMYIRQEKRDDLSVWTSAMAARRPICVCLSKLYHLFWLALWLYIIENAVLSMLNISSLIWYIACIYRLLLKKATTS